jgi:predicted phage terminase large subunit-like protein
LSNVVQSWDTATELGSTNDYSVCTTWGIQKNIYYLIDVLRSRWEYPDLLRNVKAHAQRHQINTVLIEEFGRCSDPVATAGDPAQHCSHQGNARQMTRAAQQSASIEAGRVLLPEQAPWLAELERELLGFPNARRDDQVDSMMQFLRWAAERARYEVPIVAPIIVRVPRSQEWSWLY